MTGPSIEQQRLQEVRENEQPTVKVTASSFATTVNAGDRWGFSISVDKESLDRNVSSFEDGYDSDLERLALGADFLATNRWITGISFEASNQDGNFDGGGDFDVGAHGITGFGVFKPTDTAYLQYYIGVARQDYNRNRLGVFTDLEDDGGEPEIPTTFGTQNADYQVDQHRTGALFGNNYTVAGLILSPFAGLDWMRTRYDTYTETGTSGLELVFHGDQRTSLLSSVGVQASLAITTGFWVWVPRAGFRWLHEYENKQQDIEISFAGDSRGNRFTFQNEMPDRDWGEINLGVTALSPGGLQVSGNLRTLVGNQHFDGLGLSLGVRLPL